MIMYVKAGWEDEHMQMTLYSYWVDTSNRSLIDMCMRVCDDV